MATYADVLTRARYYIQDVIPPLRQTDAELKLYLEDAIGEMFRMRPDAFPSNGCTEPDITFDLSDTFPYATRWLAPLAYWVAGSAELKDDSHVETGKAVAFIGLAKATWKGENYTNV